MGVRVGWILGGVGYIDDFAIGANINGMVMIRESVAAARDLRDEMLDLQHVTYHEIDIGLVSRPNGVERDGGAWETLNLNHHQESGLKDHDTDVENESLVNTLRDGNVD